MRVLLSVMALLFMSGCAVGQETIYKHYKVYNFIDFADDYVSIYDYESLKPELEKKVIFLSTEQFFTYDDLTITSKDQKMAKNDLDEKFRLIRSGALLSFTMENEKGTKVTISKSNVDNKSIRSNFGVKITVRAKTFKEIQTNCIMYKANLKLVKNRLYVNLWPIVSDDPASDIQVNNELGTRDTMFYELPDDHAAKFSFREWTATGLTIPIKYRFRNSRTTIVEDGNGMKKEKVVQTETFSASPNAVFFAGRTWGNTSFVYRKNIGNREVTKKVTLGGFIGFSALEISAANSDRRLGEINFDPNGTIGTFNYGLGVVASYNKLAIGVFAGIDTGVGDLAQSWIYNGNPWSGIGLGYDLFKL